MCDTVIYKIQFIKFVKILNYIEVRQKSIYEGDSLDHTTTKIILHFSAEVVQIPVHTDER